MASLAKAQEEMVKEVEMKVGLSFKREIRQVAKKVQTVTEV